MANKKSHSVTVSALLGAAIFFAAPVGAQMTGDEEGRRNSLVLEERTIYRDASRVVEARDGSGPVAERGLVIYQGHTPSANQLALIKAGADAIDLLEKTSSGDPLKREPLESQNAGRRLAAESKLIEIISIAEKEYQAELQNRIKNKEEKLVCNIAMAKCFTPAVATSIYFVVQEISATWRLGTARGSQRGVVDSSIVHRRIASYLFGQVSQSTMNPALKDEILQMIKIWHENVAKWSSGPAASRMYNRIGSDVADAFRQTQGEILKQTQAIRLIEESLAAYRIQEALRKEAADIGDVLKPSVAACVNTVQADHANQTRGNARVFAVEKTKSQISASLDDRRPVYRYITERYASSNSLYCTPRDIVNGVCKKTDYPAGDINAALVFSSDPTDEGLSETYQDPKQLAAVEAFSDRITGTRFFAEVLPMLCVTDQCQAYEEARRRMKAIESSVRGSYNYIIGRRASPSDISAAVPNKDSVSAGVKEKHAF